MKPDPCTDYEERAAVLEYEAGMTRRDAEWKARQMLTLISAGQTQEWDEEAKTRKVLNGR